MERDLSTFGQQVMEDSEVTLVLLMATPQVSTPYLWARLNGLGGKMHMTKIVREKWL